MTGTQQNQAITTLVTEINLIAMNQKNQLIEIPSWQINEVRERMEDYRKNPDLAFDFENAMDEIENDLDESN
jgi:t-SNARE complex subunit (syntaxin)